MVAQETPSMTEQDFLSSKTDSSLHIAKRGPGRYYYCPPDVVLKYSEVDALVERIAANLRVFLQIESSVRLMTDGEIVNPVTSVLSVPFHGDNDRIYFNLARLIYDQLWAYYISADPKGTHHGLTNLVMDGHETSLIRRETEKLLNLVTYRTDLCARLILGYRMDCEVPPLNRDVYMRDSVKDFMDVELGVRLYTYGEAINRATVFLPYGEKTGEAIDRIYYNMEHIIHQNLVAYDELHDHYLPVSTELIVRELEATLVRARQKGNTRKKIINGLKFHTVLLDDPSNIYDRSIADLYYDKINRIDLLDEAAQRSRELFSTALIRSAEITSDANVKVDGLPMEQHVYLERPQAAGAPARPQAQPQAQRVAAKPQAQPRKAAERKPVTVAKDGLSEL
jgi:hypothetical protein